MDKVFEALERLKTAPSFMGGTEKYKFAMNSERVLLEDYELVKSVVIELEQIKNANPSEAIKCLENLRKSANTFCQHMPEQCELNKKYADTIKQALLKAQEQEKVLEVIKEKDVDVYILQRCKTVDEYNSKIVHIIGETRELTEEEFDLLKELE